MIFVAKRPKFGVPEHFGNFVSREISQFAGILFRRTTILLNTKIKLEILNVYT